MLGVIGAEDSIENGRHIVIREGLNGLNRHYREQGLAFAVGVGEREALACLYRAALCQINDRHGPEQTVGGAHVFCHRERVGAIHVAG